MGHADAIQRVPRRITRGRGSRTGMAHSGRAVRGGLSEVPSEQSLECGRLGRTWQPRSFSVAARPAPSLAPVNALFLALRGLRLLFADVRSASGTAQRLARQQVFSLLNGWVGGWMDGWSVYSRSCEQRVINVKGSKLLRAPAFPRGELCPCPAPDGAETGQELRPEQSQVDVRRPLSPPGPV